VVAGDAVTMLDELELMHCALLYSGPPKPSGADVAAFWQAARRAAAPLVGLLGVAVDGLLEVAGDLWQPHMLDAPEAPPARWWKAAAS